MDHTKEIYTRLLHVIPNLRHIGTYATLSAPGFMDLHVDILPNDELFDGLPWRIWSVFLSPGKSNSDQHWTRR